MNKAQLVEEVSDKVGITKKDAGNVVDAVTRTITNTLKKGEKVTLVGFGTFEVRRRKARRGVNRQTREALNIPEKNVIRFRVGKGLRERVGK